jgi:Domain of unknown function (DUF3291)
MTHHLAQINIGRIKGMDMNDPIMADFVAQLDQINQLAENSEGFVWRLKGEGNNATDLLAFEDSRIIVNMSVWESVAHLEHYVFKTMHVEVLKRRKEWFERFESSHLALWYIPIGHTPTVEEAKERLLHIDSHGLTPYAFTFRKVFMPSDV